MVQIISIHSTYFLKTDMIKYRNCGNCNHFQKVTGYGICMRYDYWTQSDHGRKCRGWEGIKYNRIKNKRLIEKETQEN